MRTGGAAQYAAEAAESKRRRYEAQKPYEPPVPHVPIKNFEYAPIPASTKRSKMTARWVTKRWDKLAPNQYYVYAEDYLDGVGEIDVNNLRWSTTDKAIATVAGVAGTNRAIVTGVAAGHCGLSVFDDTSGSSGFGEIYVTNPKIPMTDATLSLSNNTVKTGDTISIQATVTVSPSNATGITTTYSISPTGSGLSVNAKGQITGLAATVGTYTVMATVKDDSNTVKTPTATLTVQDATPADTIFIQNDSDTNPGTPYYVTQVDKTHYTMAAAVAPKDAQYIGAFIWDGATNTRGGRVGGDAKWTTSDSNVVEIGWVSDSGQAVININKAGTSTLTCSFNDMVSTLVITAKTPIKSATVAVDKIDAVVGAEYSGKATPSYLPEDASGVSVAFSLSPSIGLSIDTAGNITGTPTATGTVTVTATLKDDSGNTFTPTATITVNSAATAAVLSSASANPISAQVGVTQHSVISFTLDDPDDGTYTYTLTEYNGHGTGFGYVWVSENGGTFRKITSGSYTNNPVFAMSSSTWNVPPTSAGSPDFTFTIADSVGSPSKTVKGTITITA